MKPIWCLLVYALPLLMLGAGTGPLWYSRIIPFNSFGWFFFWIQVVSLHACWRFKVDPQQITRASFLFISLFLAFFSVNSPPSPQIPHSTSSTQGNYWVLPAFALLVPRLGNPLQEESGDNHRAYFTYFLTSRIHYIWLPDIQCLKNHCCIYFVQK